MSVRRTLQLGAKDENMVAIHVTPYVLLLIATIALVVTPYVSSDLPLDTSPADITPYTRGEYFAGGYTSASYWVWVAFSVICPLLVMLSYWLPSRVHDSRYAAIWLRLGADAGQILLLFAFELSTIKVVNAEGVYRQVMFLGIVIFCVLMLTRDVYLIVASERLAHRLDHRGEAGGD